MTFLFAILVAVGNADASDAHSDTQRKRVSALEAMVRTAPDEASTREIRSSLRSDDVRVRLAAAYVAVRHDIESKDAILILQSGIESESEPTRNTAAWYLRCLGVHATAAVPSVVKAWRTGRIESKQALPILQNSGAKAVLAFDLIEMKMGAFNDHEFAMACQTLAKTGRPGVPLLVKQLAGQSQRRRKQAIHSIGDVGPSASKATQELVKIVQNEPSNEIRAAAFLAIAKIGPGARNAVPILIGQLRDHKILTRTVVGEHSIEKPVAAYAADALGSIGSLDALEPLGQIIDALDIDNPPPVDEVVLDAAARARGKLIEIRRKAAAKKPKA